MPTYAYECPDEHVHEEFHDMKSFPRAIECPTCGKEAQKVINWQGGMLFEGDLPTGENIKRQEADEKIMQKAQVARRMKYHGKVPMQETIHAKDVDLAKVTERDLPPIVPGSKPVKGLTPNDLGADV